MSEGSGGEQISPDGNWRWDGHNWVPNTPAQQPQQPQQPPYGQQPYGQAPYGQPPAYPQQPQQPYGYTQVPQKESHTLRNVLLILGLVFILFAGGCVAIIGLAANEVDNAIEEIEANDDAPGGVDNPLTITEGEGFNVYGFEYQDGWSVAADSLGDIDIVGLKFENNRDEADSAYAEIKFFAGNELVGMTSCTSEVAQVDQIVPLTCFSTEDLPATYDKITIADSF
ncbi:MAG: hypothetical protein Q8O61_16800 [Nocardioides sp.]|nr:hypothetical protein [Nocardioides sp.]